MNEDLLNILSNKNVAIDNQKLIDYLNNNLTASEKHEFEQQMANSNLLNDAIEGLEKFSDKKDILHFAKELNDHLKKQLEKKKAYHEKRKIKYLPWLYLTIVLILIIILISFLLIKIHL
jgi:hypothetical protein